MIQKFLMLCQGVAAHQQGQVPLQEDDEEHSQEI